MISNLGFCLGEYWLNLTWTCHICGASRSDEFISVHQHERGDDYGFPSEMMVCNVRYCNDNEDCTRKAADPAYPHHGQASKYKDNSAT